MSYSDPLDQASDIAAMHNERAIAKQRSRMKPEQVRNPDGTWPVTECVKCGDDIPPERVAMAKIRCVYCQERLENGK